MLHNGRRRHCPPELSRLRLLGSAPRRYNNTHWVLRHIHNRETAAQITDAVRQLRRKLCCARWHTADAETFVQRRRACIIISGQPNYKPVLCAGNGNIQQARLFSIPLPSHALPAIILPLAIQPAHINLALQIIRVGAKNWWPIMLQITWLLPFNWHQHHRELQALGCVYCMDLHRIRVTLHAAADEFMRFLQPPEGI